ncbi:MAG: hypothetical protein MJZ27_08860 [Bacteroidales bacterium]|nr:hypothetical protein [Bacteroidales bacterium]
MTNHYVEFIDKRKVNKWLRLLKDPKSDKVNVWIATMEECNYLELCLLSTKCPHVLSGLLSLSMIRRKSYKDVFKNKNIQPIKPVDDYIGLMIYVIRQNAKLLNEYISLRSKIDNYALRGNYHEAKKLLTIVNTSISYSYWAANYEIKIERLENGLDSCTSFYNKLYTENNTIARLYYYCAYVSSSLDYPSDKMNTLLWPKEKENSEYVNNVIISHCMPYQAFTDGEWIRSDCNSSIVDLYNNLINYLPNLSPETLNNDKVRFYLSELSKIIEDPYVDKLCHLYGISDKCNLSDVRRTILDSYSRGNYAMVIELAKGYLDDITNDIEILSLYLKSYILSGIDPGVFDKEGSIFERVCYHYYEILRHSENVAVHKNKLIGICKSQCHIYGMRHLYTILSNLDNHSISNVYSDTWKYSIFSNPTDCVVFNDSTQRYDYIKSLGLDETFWNTIFYDDNHLLSPDFYEMTIAQKDDSSIFGNIISLFCKNIIAPYNQDILSSYVVNKYIDLGQPKMAIEFYVNNRLNHSELSIIFDKDKLSELISQDVSLLSEIPLELSIYYYLINTDTDTIYLSYKNCLKRFNLKKASDIVVNGDLKQRYFLTNIVVPKIITLHVLRFKSVKDVMEERIKICSSLYDFYNDKKYNDEISSLCRDLKIRELNNQVDDSKIYVDVNSIRENEMEDAKSLYDIYEGASSNVNYYSDSSLRILLSKLMSMGLSVKQIDSDSQLYAISDSSASEHQEQTNYRLDVMKRLFLNVRDQFLFNPKYGLDNYLSTRIRHGTLVNKLRNHFEQNSLVTNIVDEEYAINTFWVNSRFGVKDKTVLQCVSRFNEFSKKVDGVIANFKNECVQVKTETETSKMKACFNYDIKYFENFINELIIDESIKSFCDCYDAIINELWQHTDECLESVKDELYRIQASLIDALHTLGKDINNILPNNNSGLIQFNDAIGHCQNDIQNDIQAVARWFKRKNYEDFDFTLSQVIQTCIDSINDNNKKSIATVLNCNLNTALKGTYFGTLYDMFHDILNNAYDYDTKNNIGGVCNIDINLENEFLIVYVCNPILPEHAPSLEKKVMEINSTLDAMFKSGKSRNEGNSGCSKIFNAVHNHLGSDHNTYRNEIKDANFIVNIAVELSPLKK